MDNRHFFSKRISYNINPLLQKVYIIFCLFTQAVTAQLNISGQVLDQRGEPVPFANVLFSNSTEGTTTDFDGFFELYSKKNHQEITVQLLGYQTQFVKLNKVNNPLKIVIIEGEQLSDVLVVQKPKKRLKKKENPAYRILKEVWKRKANIGLPQLDAFAYDKYTSVEVGLNNMDTIFLEKFLRKSLDSILGILSQNRKNNLFYIPLNLKEESWKIYGDNRNNLVRSDLVAKRISGLETNGFFFSRIENVFKYVNVMDETVVVADKSFASPIAKTGFINYDYVLVDSLQTGQGKDYNIYFFPRRDGDWAFEGNLTVSSPAYALKHIEMYLNPKINLNILRDVRIKQDFEEIKPGIFLPFKNSFQGDFSVLTKNENEKGLYLNKTETYRNYVLNIPQDEDFYKKLNEVRTNSDLSKSNYYWLNANKEDLTAKTRLLLFNLKDNQKIKSITSTVDFLTTGYKQLTPSFQFGKWWDSFNFNDVEGFRLNLGFRTYKSLDDRFRSTSFLAYGFKDRKIKYGIDGRYLLSYQPRISVGLVYAKDFEQLGGSIFTTGIMLDSRTLARNNLLSRGTNFYLSDVETFGLSLNWEMFKNFYWGFNIETKHIAPADDQYFSIDFIQDEKILKQYNNALFSSFLTFTPNRNVYGYGVDQKLGRNNFASFSLKYLKGLKGILSGDFLYDQLQFSYNQPIRVGFLGILESNLELGKTFGTVPIALLTALPANQGYTLQRKTFSLINYYDWVTDSYIAGHFEHHFNGFLMNKIPIIEKLKWRALATFRFAYGSISDAQVSANQSSIHYNAPEKKPYYEVSCGIENIGFGNFKFFRIDFIWRSSLPNSFKSNSTENIIPKFGIRLGARPDL